MANPIPAMHTITLIGTIHQPSGNCNLAELYKIIESIRPEIIFEELSPAGFAAIYEDRRADTLETSTIKSYLENRPIDHFPVDLDGNEFVDKHLKEKISEMFDFFKRSHDYIDLSIELGTLSDELGFSYLNSDRCKELLKRRHLAEELVVRTISDEQLIQTYKSWLHLLNMRERAMIENIYQYSALHKYDRALFLVGAEHRELIMAKIHQFEVMSDLKLNWIFDYFNFQSSSSLPVET